MGDFSMKNAARRWLVVGTTLLVSGTAAAGLTLAEEASSHSPAPVHYAGLINDYTPSAAVTKGGPYEMRGKWTLDVDERRGFARFSAAITMETSDFGITQGTVNKDEPSTRGAHTHHISVTDGVVNSDWMRSCPKFSVPVTDGFVITGMATIAGNGGPAPFGNPSPVTICVLGGGDVKYSNITIAFGAPASSHFGTQAINGVVVRCSEPWEQNSRDCTLEE
jgi:hypothetical protein